jgi:hypothetical protein
MVTRPDAQLDQVAPVKPYRQLLAMKYSDTSSLLIDLLAVPQSGHVLKRCLDSRCM